MFLDAILDEGRRMCVRRVWADCCFSRAMMTIEEGELPLRRGWRCEKNVRSFWLSWNGSECVTPCAGHGVVHRVCRVKALSGGDTTVVSAHTKADSMPSR